MGLCLLLAPIPVLMGGATCRAGGSPMRGMSESTGVILATSSNKPPKSPGLKPRSCTSSAAVRFCTY